MAMTVALALPEDEALEWAIEFFKTRRVDLTADGSRRRGMERCVDFLMEIYEASGRDRDHPMWQDLMSHDLCREFAATLLERDIPLPTLVLCFTRNFLRVPTAFKGRKGRDGTKLEYRNLLISFVIRTIAERWQLAPSRNDATECASAASIVRDALKRGANIHLKEAAINKIWGRVGPGLHKALDEATRGPSGPSDSNRVFE